MTFIRLNLLISLPSPPNIDTSLHQMDFWPDGDQVSPKTPVLLHLSIDVCESEGVT